MQKLKWRNFRWEAFVFVVALVCFERLWAFTNFSLFQERDLERARALAHGHMIFFGPEMIGGGHLPGPFYYFLLALPLKLGMGFTGAWHLMIFMGALSVAIAYRTAEKFSGQTGALMATAALLCLPQMCRTLMQFQNYSYLPLFVVLVLAGLIQSFATREPRGGWLMACAAGALGVQLHMSISFLGLAALVMQIFARPLGLTPLPRRIFAQGFGVLGLILAPYLIWLTASRCGINWGQIPPTFVNAANPTGTDFVSTLVFRGGNLTFLTATWRAIVRWDEWSHILLGLTSIPLTVLLVRAWLGPAERANAVSRVGLICLLALTPPAIVVFYNPHRTRYLTCLVLAGFFVVADFLQRRLGKLEREQTKRILLSVSLAVVVGAIFNLRRHLHGIDFQPRLDVALWSVASLATCCVALKWWKPATFAATLFTLALTTVYTRYSAAYKFGRGFYLPSAVAIARTIRQQTGWSWDEASARLYTVGVQYQRSLGSAYRDESENSPLTPPNSLPNGYVYVSHFGVDDTADTQLTQSLMDQLPRDLRHGILNGDIFLGAAQAVPNGYLMDYRINKPDLYPSAFQNIGENYLTRQPAQVSDPTPLAQSSKKVGRNHLRISFNDCPRLDPFCSIHFEIQRDKSNLKVRLHGDVISQTSPWISPSWIQNIKFPFITVQCAPDSKAIRVQIVSEVGSTRDAMKLREVREVLGPVEKSFVNPCPDQIFKLAAGFESSLVTVSRSRFELPGRVAEEREF